MYLALAEGVAKMHSIHTRHLDPDVNDPALQMQQPNQLNAPTNVSPTSAVSLDPSDSLHVLSKGLTLSVIDHAILDEIKKTIFKLVASAKKHPKSLAIWTEIAQLKEKHKILSKSDNADMLLKLSVASDGAKSKASSVDSLDIMHSYSEKAAKTASKSDAKISSSDKDNLQAALITSKAI